VDNLQPALLFLAQGDALHTHRVWKKSLSNNHGTFH
jgi:hypothetical protein